MMVNAVDWRMDREPSDKERGVRHYGKCNMDCVIIQRL